MRLLVTGDREWTSGRAINVILEYWHARFGIDVLIEGCARGADQLAGAHELTTAEGKLVHGWAWGHQRAVQNEHMPADWKRYSLRAGPIRNRAMLNLKPDLVAAFHNDLPGSRGTADMVKISIDEDLPVVLVSINPKKRSRIDITILNTPHGGMPRFLGPVARVAEW